MSPNPICTVDDCGEPAIASYVWAWGESGVCCARHQVILRQKAGQLKQSLQVTPLQPGAPAEETRDERIAKQAKLLTLEEELSEARDRGMQLYRQVESLQQQGRVQTLKIQEMEAQLRDLGNQLEKARIANGELRQQAARENDELQQLRALAKAPDLVAKT